MRPRLFLMNWIVSPLNIRQPLFGIEGKGLQQGVFLMVLRKMK